MIKNEIRNKTLNEHHTKKMKSSHIRKPKKNKDLEKMRNQLAFEKEF